jgi:signal transduction histidine kinase
VTDRVKLKTILKNLIGNALKFPLPAASMSRRVGPTARQCSRPRHRDRHRRRASARDLRHVSPVDSSSTRRFGGVGLGLHIARRLIDLLGGTITVASTPNAGSTFTVTVPLRAMLDLADAPGAAAG